MVWYTALDHTPAQFHQLAWTQHTIQAVSAEEQLHVGDAFSIDNVPYLQEQVVHALREHLRIVAVQDLTAKSAHDPLRAEMAVRNAEHQRSLADCKSGGVFTNGNGRHFARRPNDRFPLCFAAGLSPVGFIDLIALIAQLLDVALRFAFLRVLIKHPGVRGLSYASAHLSQLVRMEPLRVLLRNLRPVLVRGAGDFVVHLPHLCLFIAHQFTSPKSYT